MGGCAQNRFLGSKWVSKLKMSFSKNSRADQKPEWTKGPRTDHGPRMDQGTDGPMDQLWTRGLDIDILSD